MPFEEEFIKFECGYLHYSGCDTFYGDIECEWSLPCMSHDFVDLTRRTPYMTLGNLDALYGCESEERSRKIKDLHLEAMETIGKIVEQLHNTDETGFRPHM